MKTQWIVIIVLILILVLYLSRNKIKSVMTRAYINNNPGNINLEVPKNTMWVGEKKSTDSRFKQFISMPYGYRAMFVNLKGYFAHGLNTIQEIISSWAPAKDHNDTTAYIAAVSSKLGKKPTDILKFTDTATMRQLVKAISEQESGIPANMDDLDEGYKLFNA